MMESTPIQLGLFLHSSRSPTRIVGGARTTQGTKNSFEESISLSREIKKYMDIRSYMQSVRDGLSSMATDGGNAKTRKKTENYSGTTNIVLNSEDEGSLGEEFCQKRSGDWLGVIVNHGPLEGFSCSLFTNAGAKKH
ncbi:hypothetical protein J1N35_022072 [Gossypium stocksii]|uniref:Uncharacterized protein n=1 Tax=Gossypium stocksii TaxID=47602 RepID=A0A9D4A0S6_9ROSI|nr:hypothetical protein J1N35_022072 [Gossypium stocksii]